MGAEDSVRRPGSGTAMPAPIDPARTEVMNLACVGSCRPLSRVTTWAGP